MPTRSQVVAYARTLIGIGEDPPGSNRNIVTQTYGYVGAWCAMTTWYIYKHFGLDLKEEFTTGWAATMEGATAAMNAGLWHTDISKAQPGDLVYFKLPGGDAGWVNHTGVIVGVNGRIARTIEGNTGNVCAERVRVDHIVGYIDMSRYLAPVPKPTPSAPPFPGTKAFVLGRTHSAVTTLDTQLIRLGYTKSHDGDGYQAGPKFTKWTRENVRQFQRDQGWTGADADGYPGPETWRRLFTTPSR